MQEIIFNGTSYRTHKELPAIGSRAPDVSLVNTELQDVSLANFMGKRKILNIFPSIDTPVCAKSVIVFDQLAEDYDDVAMIMVSYDLPFAHERFQQEHSLDRVVRPFSHSSRRFRQKLRRTNCGRATCRNVFESGCRP